MLRLRPLPRILSAALRDATDAKSEVRRSAVADLGRFVEASEREQAEQQLIHSLTRDDEPGVRAAAAEALADLKAPAALPALLDASFDPHPRVRQMAILALGEIENAEQAVVDRLQAACRDELPGLRFQALISMRRVAPERAVRELSDALLDDDEKIRYIAIRLLEEIGGVAIEDEAVKPRLRACLEDAAASVRLAAALVPSFAKERAANKIIVHALNSSVAIEDPDDEQAAIASAGQSGLKEAIPGLKRRLGGWLVRKPFDWQARVALCRLGDVATIDRLVRDLEASSSYVRLAAIAVSVDAAVQRALPVLRRMKPSNPEEAEARNAALQALSQLGG